jgi:ribonuclease E
MTESNPARVEATIEDANAGIPDASLRMQQHLPGTPGEGGGRRRRRRRRRGRRGQGNAQNAGQQFGAEPSHQESGPGWDDRFGAGDEIDTTPRDDRGTTPNASSAPNWSLGGEATRPPAAISEPIESLPESPARHAEPAPQLEPKPAEPAQSPKKGWWQRAFRSE